MHTGVGHESQLICVVHAEPQAHVIWYKETTQIGTTEQLSQQVNTRIDLIVLNLPRTRPLFGHIR